MGRRNGDKWDGGRLPVKMPWIITKNEQIIGKTTRKCRKIGWEERNQRRRRKIKGASFIE